MFHELVCPSKPLPLALVLVSFVFVFGLFGFGLLVIAKELLDRNLVIWEVTRKMSASSLTLVCIMCHPLSTFFFSVKTNHLYVAYVVGFRIKLQRI